MAVNTAAEQRRSSLDAWFSPSRFLLLAASLVGACFLPVIIGQETFFFRDFAIFSYPLAAYHRESFWRGELPLWNPFNYCGLPFLAQWNTLVLYPFSLIYLIFPLPWSLNVFCLGHMVLAALGMYLLARRWSGSNFAGAVAGLGFIFGGVVLSCLKWPNNIAALGWMPWVVLATERAWSGSWRDVGLASLAGAFQMLCGAPEIIFLTWILCGAIALQRFAAERPFHSTGPLRFAIIVALIAGLGAAQLLPFIELVQESQRGEDFAHSYWSMPIWGWANLLVPIFRTIPSYHGVHAQPGQYWISTYYIGLPLIICAVYGLTRARSARHWMLAVLAILSLWLALGEKGLLYSWARSVIPGLGMMRFPVKFVVLAAFLLPLLAALGISKIFASPSPGKTLGWIGGVLLAAIFGLCLHNEFRPFPFITPAMMNWNGLWRGVFLVVAMACLIALNRIAPEKQRLPAILFLCVLVLDGLTHAPWQNPTAPYQVYAGSATEIIPKPILGKDRAMMSPEAAFIVDHLMLDDPSEDVLASRASLYCNLNLLERIPKVDGFYALYPRELADVIDPMYHVTNRPPSGILDFLGVTRINEVGSWKRWEKREALPLVQAPRNFLVSSNCVTNLLGADFNPREIVYLSRAPETAFNNAKASIGSITAMPEEISFSYRSPASAFLVIAQSYSRNWRAHVDGQPVKIVRANHAFQAIAAPPGNHRVTLRYEASAFRLGQVISALAAMLVTVLILLGTGPALDRQNFQNF
jgi:hypothetical protein